MFRQIAALGLVLLAGSAAAESISARSVAAQYAAIVYANYADTLVAARTMRTAIDAFVAQPTAARQLAAQQTWLAAREWYGQSEAFRFYGGPIDGSQGPEPRINAWPVDEVYMDGVPGRPGAGIINDPKTPITKKQLSALNERGGEENIATGWHAIEFLLWGQDSSATGPGQRSFEDFVDGKTPHAKRRRQYLKVVTGLLLDDLDVVAKAWQPNANNYRARFVADPDEALRRMLVGIGSLSRGELAGERLEVALATQDQEDEHSCFSDNTHRDIVANALGIENVWLGRYRRIDGTLLQGASLSGLVAMRNLTLTQQVTADLAATLRAADALRAPFDQEIRGGSDAPGRLRVQAVITALQQQSRDLVSSAGALGITRLTLSNPKHR